MINQFGDLAKLPKKEALRFMGFDDKDADILAKNDLSKTQVYKQAGNLIVVKVVQEIVKGLLKSGVLKKGSRNEVIL